MVRLALIVRDVLLQRRLNMKDVFVVPKRICEVEPDDPDFSGTQNEIRDTILDYLEDGGVTRTSPVYTFDIGGTNTAVRYPGTVGDLLNDLERYIATGHGNSLWQFDREDGWHDPVVCLAVYRRGSRWILLIGVEPGYQDEDEV
jgi:hypothetical protein